MMQSDEDASGATAAGSAKEVAASLRFGFLIHDVSRLRRVVVDRVLKPIGLTRSQWWLLSFLGRRDGMTQSALAAEVDMTKVAIGGLIGRMESAGFVERRGDEADGRLRRVYLASAGVKALRAIKEQIAQIEVDIMVGVSTDDLSTASASLTKLKDKLRNMAEAEAEREA